jgi:hypothetical protein
VDAAMISVESENTLVSIKRGLGAWQAHLERLGLADRIGFIEWLATALDPKEFAATIDAEIERRTLWRTYLRERYGPCCEQSRRA